MSAKVRDIATWILHIGKPVLWSAVWTAGRLVGQPGRLGRLEGSREPQELAAMVGDTWSKRARQSATNASITIVSLSLSLSLPPLPDNQLTCLSSLSCNQLKGLYTKTSFFQGLKAEQELTPLGKDQTG